MRTGSYVMYLAIEKKRNLSLLRIMMRFSLNSLRVRKRGNKDERFKFPVKMTPKNEGC